MDAYVIRYFWNSGYAECKLFILYSDNTYETRVYSDKDDISKKRNLRLMSQKKFTKQQVDNFLKED